MCFKMSMNPKCQMCIRVSIVILLIFIVVQLILAIVKGVFTKNMITADVMQEILKMSLTPQEIEDLEGAFDMMALVISLFTVAGILCGLVSLCAARFCNKQCNGCWTKWYVAWSAIVFIAVAIIFFLVGSVLVVIKDQLDEDFINRECANAQARRVGDAKLKLGVTDVDI